MSGKIFHCLFIVVSFAVFSLSCSGNNGAERLDPMSEILNMDNSETPNGLNREIFREGAVVKGSLQFGGSLGHEFSAPGSVALSGDGKHLYVTDYQGKILWFDSAVSNGELPFLGSYTGSRINGAISVAISPNDNHVYVASSLGNSVSLFSRNSATGELIFVNSLEREELRGIKSIVLSPDGKNLYAVSQYSNSVTWFSIESSTGVLSYMGSFSNLFTKGAWSVTVSSDGKNVYAGAFSSGSIVVFARDLTTGALTYIEKHQGLYLKGTIDVKLSSDGKNLYALSYLKKTISWFERDIATGELSPDDYWQSPGDSDKYFSMNLSQDGRHLYVNTGDIFTRSPDGSLTRVEGSAYPSWGGIPSTPPGISISFFKSIFNVDDSICYSSSLSGGCIIAYDRNVATGKFSYRGIFSSHKYSRTQSIALLPDGSNLYIQKLYGKTAELLRFSIDSNSGKPELSNVISHADYIYATDRTLSRDALQISPDGEYLYSMFTYETGNCSTYLFSLNADGLPSFSNAIDMSEDSNYHISHFSMSPDGNMVICGLKNIYVRDSGSGGLTPLEMKQLSGGEDNFIRNNSFLWFPPQGSPLPLPRSFDGTLLYSPANYGIVCQKITIDEDEKVLCETQDELSISNLDPESPYRGLSEIVESPNGQLIYGACVDANSLACFFRNENNGELNLASYFSDSRIDGASSIAMTKDGEFIYVACASTGIIAWFSRNDETGEVTYMGRYRNSECLYGLHSLRVLCDAAGAGKFLYGLGKESETLVWFKIVE